MIKRIKNIIAYLTAKLHMVTDCYIRAKVGGKKKLQSIIPGKISWMLNSFSSLT